MKLCLLFLFSFLLCSCTSSLSTQITNNANNEIKALQKDFVVFSSNIPDECKNVIGGALDGFYARLENINNDIKTFPVACESEKKELKLSNTIYKLCNLFLCFIMFGLVYIILKRK